MMMKKVFFFLSLFAFVALSACAGAPTKDDQKKETDPPATSENEMSENPLFVESDLPYKAPRFDLIKDEHFLPAYEAGMKAQLEESKAITSNEEAPTFENTVIALEQSGGLLERAARIFSNLSSAHTNDTLKEVQTKVAPLYAAHVDAIYLDEALYQRISTLYEARETLGLDAESLYLLERYHTDFVRAGARVAEADKPRLKEINAEVAALMTKVGQNILEETNNSAVVVDTKEELAGLSEAQINAAAKAATEAGHEGKYLLTLRNTTIQPVLTTMENRALRARVHQASILRGSRDNEYDNRPLLVQLAKLRAERAALMGYVDAASYKLEDQTAKNTKAVNEMLALIAKPAVANARAEATKIQALIDAEGGDFKVEAWDWLYYSEKVRKAEYDLDESQLKPYFEMDNVLQNGVFYSANELFGLEFKERTDLPTYHPDVRVWEVIDHNGEGIGILYTDFFARPSKRGGAWMNAYQLQSGLLENRPVVGNHLNVTKPEEGAPALMTPDEVETLYHEFGHALHGLLSNVNYPRFAGTNVPRDFVEFPSQVYEMWAFWPQVLERSARHHETGEALPQELVDKLLAARGFNQGYATTEYISAAIIDQAWHQLPADQIPADVDAFEAKVLAEAGLDFAVVPPRYKSTYFNHVFAGGYWSGYYSYIWAEVLDAATTEWFEVNGGLTRENGQKIRAAILSRGGSQDAMELYLELNGEAPSIDPLLKRRGLAKQEI